MAKKIVEPQAALGQAWGKIDQQVTQSAAAVPWLWENFPSVFSKRVTAAPSCGTAAPPT